MGLCCSCECWKTCCVSDWELRYREVFHAHEEELRALRFEIDETRKMYQVFVSIDRKALGWISYKKVLAYCKINETPFVRSIFVVFDKRKTEHICFRDFFMIIYDYCTLAPQQLVEFVFHHYDEDNGGSLDIAEAQKIIEDMYGREYKKFKEPRKVHALLTLKAATEVGGISLDNFVELAKLHPTFLQSCRDFQTLLRQRIVSWEFWMKHSKKRIQNYGGRTYIALPLIFKKQEAPLRRPDMPRCVKRLGVRQEEDSEGGDEDEEWGENAVKPFHQLVEELQENDVDSLKPRSIEDMPVTEKLLKSYLQIAESGDTALQTLELKKQAKARCISPEFNNEAWFKEVLLTSPAKVAPMKTVVTPAKEAVSSSPANVTPMKKSRKRHKGVNRLGSSVSSI